MTGLLLFAPGARRGTPAARRPRVSGGDRAEILSPGQFLPGEAGILTNSFLCSLAGLSNRAFPLTRIHADRFAVYLGVRFIRQAQAHGDAQR